MKDGEKNIGQEIDHDCLKGKDRVIIKQFTSTRNGFKG